MQDTIPHSISLTEAIQLTQRFQESRPIDMPICETFEKDSVRAMLSVAGADKLRIYYGEKENGDICAVLVAANESNEDILPTYDRKKLLTDDQDDGIILEDSFRCPENCPPDSPLN